MFEFVSVLFVSKKYFLYQRVKRTLEERKKREDDLFLDIVIYGAATIHTKT